MSVTLILPGSLKAWLGGRAETPCQGNNIGECIDNLDDEYPGFKQRVVDEKGDLSHSVLIFKNGENIRNQKGLATPVADGDVIGVIPLAAGG